MDERQEAAVYKTLANAFFLLLVCMWACLLIRPNGRSLFVDNTVMALSISSVAAIYLQVALVIQDAYIERWHQDSKVTLGGLSLISGLFDFKSVFDDLSLSGFGIWRHQQFQQGFADLLGAILMITVGGTLICKGMQERRANREEH